MRSIDCKSGLERKVAHRLGECPAAATLLEAFLAQDPEFCERSLGNASKDSPGRCQRCLPCHWLTERLAGTGSKRSPMADPLHIMLFKAQSPTAARTPIVHIAALANWS